jgi:hypothetical protein
VMSSKPAGPAVRLPRTPEGPDLSARTDQGLRLHHGSGKFFARGGNAPGLVRFEPLAAVGGA